MPRSRASSAAPAVERTASPTSVSQDDPYPALDAALLATRRLWSHPGRRVGPRVDLSTVLVCEAVTGQARSVSDVADALEVAPSTASRLVDRAVRAGVLDSTADSRDQRRRTLGLTAAGDELVAKGRAFRRERLRGLTASWAAADVATLARLLFRFTEALHASAQHPNPQRSHPTTTQDARPVTQGP